MILAHKIWRNEPAGEFLQFKPEQGMYILIDLPPLYSFFKAVLTWHMQQDCCFVCAYCVAEKFVDWSLKDIGDFKLGKLNILVMKYPIWLWLSRGPFPVLHGECECTRLEVLVISGSMDAYISLVCCSGYI